MKKILADSPAPSGATVQSFATLIVFHGLKVDDYDENGQYKGFHCKYPPDGECRRVSDCGGEACGGRVG